MSQPVVLRPALYSQLQRRYGSVGVANRGVEAVLTTREINGRLRRVCDKNKGGTWGEVYHINCVHCGDTRRRLYIGHLWGKLDEQTGDHLYSMIACQNEGCFADFWQQKAFHSEVWSSGPPNAAQDVLMRPTAESKYGEFEWPGSVWPLARTPPDHRVRRYVASRGYDPVWLSDRLGVGVIIEAKPKWHFLAGWLLIPIFVNGEPVGWQARYPGNEAPPNDLPKYFALPGMPRGQILYNIDSARGFPFGVVLEGATKVWRFGPEAVATFGKKVTGYQAALMSASWKKVYVALDPNALRESEDLLKTLANSCEVVKVTFPDGVEPDEMNMLELRKFVFSFGKD